MNRCPSLIPDEANQPLRPRRHWSRDSTSLPRAPRGCGRVFVQIVLNSPSFDSMRARFTTSGTVPAKGTSQGRPRVVGI